MSTLLHAEQEARTYEPRAEGLGEGRPIFVGGPRLTALEMFGRDARNNHADWFAGAEIHYVHAARTAIQRALSLLALSPGDEILVPAYHCGSELDVLLKAGATVRLFRTSITGEIDLDDLRSRITGRTRAIYVIHYFGFAQPLQPIVELCRTKGLFLIEDCALSLLTEVNGRRIGSDGDMAVYNFPKTLPVPDGGALVVNNPDLKCRSWSLRPPSLPGIACNAARLLRQGLLHALPDTWVRRLFAIFRSGPEIEPPQLSPRPEMPEAYFFRPAMRGRSMSRLSTRIMARMDLTEVRRRRRLNYSCLLKRLSKLSGIELLFKTMPANVCPLFLPILTAHPREMVHRLHSFSIPAIAWWAGYHPFFPANSEFPEARYLKDHVIALPIHQQLDEPAIEFIGDRLEDCLIVCAT